MGEREGWVIAHAAHRYCGGRDENGDEIDVSDLDKAVVFADEASAVAMRNCGAVISIAEANALRQKLGDVCAEAFDKVREDMRSKLPAAFVLTPPKWEEVAAAVVAEHERRKR